MKILAVSPKSDVFPVGIAYISAAIKQAGHDVDCYIFDKADGLIKQLEKKYDFVATGGMSNQFAYLKNITKTTKNTGTKVIVGGGIITSEPELMSWALNTDYAVLGEGEETIVHLLSTIENNERLPSVNSIGYFEDGRFILTPGRKQIENLDCLPWPYYDGFEFNKYLDSLKPTDQFHYDIFDYPREYPIITSRSCPFLCTFCYHPLGNKYRQRSLNSIMEELEVAIPKYRINIVTIYDELFSHNEERVYEFCRMFKKFRESLPWDVRWVCQIRVDNKVNKDMLNIMRNAGCYMVGYGFESYNKTVLKSMKKYITPQQIHHAIHTTLDSNMSLQATFIFGDKAETLQTAQETLDFWKDHIEAGIMLGFILPCPNSELYQYCIKKGIIKDRLDFIENHLYDIINMTAMSNAEFSKLEKLFYKYIARNNIKAIPLKRTSTSIVIQCPHCKKIVEYKNFRTYKRLFLFYFQIMYCRNCRKRFFSVNRLFKIFSNYISIPFIYPFFSIYKKFYNLSLLRGNTLSTMGKLKEVVRINCKDKFIKIGSFFRNIFNNSFKPCIENEVGK